MPKKNILALAISDIHIHNWKSHNENMRRTLSTMEMLNYISNKALKYGVPILFPGDLFHGDVGPTLLTLVSNHWPEYFRDNLISISGNHDQEEKSYPESPTNSMVNYFGHLKLLKCIDYNSLYIGDGVRVWGIPYITYNKGLVNYINNLEVYPRDKNILLIHTDLYGALETDGREVDSVEGIPRDMSIFNKFDLVLCGHIHKAQEIIPGKIVMVGAPNQQRKSDAQGEFGYWEIYEDLTYTFKELTHMPKFRFYDEGSMPSNDTDYWIMNRRDGIETPDEDELEFSSNSNSTSLAKAFLKATGEKRISRRKALINILKEADNDKF